MLSKSRTFYAKRNIWTGMINRIIILGFPFIIRTIVIRVLGAEYLGLSSLFSSILQVLNMAELGFSSVVVFSLYKPIAEGDKTEICALMSFYRNVYKVIGFVILGVGSLILPFLPHLIHGTYSLDLNIYLLYFIYLLNTAISYLAFAYKNVLFSASQRQDVINNINSIVSITKFCIQIAILIILKNYYLYIILNVLFTFIENIIIAIITKRDYPEYICSGTISENKRKEITKQIKGLAIGQLTKVSRNSFDSIVLSMFCGLIDVAIYSNYYYVFNAVMGILSIVIQSINAGIGNSITSESVEKNYRDFSKFYFYISCIGSICTVCFFSLYQPFMRLWVGESYMAPFSTMVLFCVYFYIIQMGLIRSAYSNATGIWWECRWIQIIEMLSNLVLNFILGYLFGMNGVLLATIITVFAFSIIGLTKVLFRIYFKKQIGSFLKDSFLYLIITIVTLGISHLLSQNIKNDTFLGLSLIAITVLLITMLVWGISGYLLPKSRNYIEELVYRIRG